MRRVNCGLVVEDDPSMSVAVASFLRLRAERVLVAADIRQAERHLDEATRIDSAIVDLALPDGNGVKLLDRLFAQPVLPRVIVVTGSATPDAAFALAQSGVRGFIHKPFSLEQLERTWEEAVNGTPDLRPLLRASVGHVALHAMEASVRQSMTEEALAIAESNRRRASGILGISRQLLQHILHPDRRWR
jgi:DNA-binding NtrC family response regulator